ncbi:MAG: hypothetical protein ACREBE_29160 [bacterium]
MNLEREASIIVRRFVVRVQELARRAALSQIESALNVAAARYGSHAVAVPMRALSGRLAKRSQQDIEALSLRLVAFIERNPGLRVEEINRQLGTETRELVRPIRQLVSGGTLRCEGRNRARRYFVVQKHAPSGVLRLSTAGDAHAAQVAA